MKCQCTFGTVLREDSTKSVFKDPTPSHECIKVILRYEKSQWLCQAAMKELIIRMVYRCQR